MDTSNEEISLDVPHHQIANIQKERKAISDLKPAKYNPRKRLTPDDDEYKKLKKSIETFGYVDPIIINADGTVIGGHQRLYVLRDLGYQYVDVAVVNLTKTEEKSLNLALNKIAGHWDDEKLAQVFAELNIDGCDLSATGFNQDEISDILKDIKLNQIDLENADEVIHKEPECPVTEIGDIWCIGNHRLICGDSTHVETYRALLKSELAQLIITDPPYNVDYEGEAGKIINDKMKDDEFHSFLFRMYSTAAKFSDEGCGIYVFHSDSQWRAFRDEFQNAGFLLKQCLIWVKNTFVIGRQDYQWRHEPILYGWKKGASHYFTASRKLSTVLDNSGRPDVDNLSREEMAELLSKIYDMIDEIPTSILYCNKPLKNKEHPTMKPTSLIAKLIENSSRENWIVLDMFGGSGSTLIACEATGRKARLIELDPKFCDVIVKRYIETTRKNDVRLIRGDKEISIKDLKL